MMSLAGRDTTATLQRLEAALDAPGIPPKALAGCRSLIEKLRRPVTLGLFGPPGAGKSLILNALAGQAVAPADLDLPTLEVGHGDTLGLTAMLADGSSIARPGLPGPDLLDEDPIFVRVTTPEETLKGLTVVNVVTEENGEDLSAALNWAATKCHISLWCTRSWTALERTAWRNAPDSLKNHAVMIVSREARRSRVKVSPEDEFEHVLHVPPLKVFGVSGVAGRLRADDLELLLTHVQQVIDDAVAEDVDSALMFLHRYEPTAKKSSIYRAQPNDAADQTDAMDDASESDDLSADAPESGPSAEPATDVATADVSDTPVTRPIPLPVSRREAKIAPEATAALSRAFHYVRQRANDVLENMPSGPIEDEQASHLLGQLEDAVVSLVAFTEFEQAFAETWPNLHSAILDANEIVLLLRIEGGTEQVSEAAALMLQLRQEMEKELAA